MERDICLYKLLFPISHNAQIDINEFQETDVLREKGRIDVWIRDNKSGKCILIENKINNAVDREDQLLDYYRYSKDMGFSPLAIVYLSLDGKKTAPEQSHPLDISIINVPAFNNTEKDLVNGWLNYCIE
ncbi:MAG TPA: PD-(D/E)XK nuclease family protein, partial [Chitinophagaceae bacterium]|nr:PD-(D/E)XK nuclease family protein [Chitinophagaceae bacterium]